LRIAARTTPGSFASAESSLFFVTTGGGWGGGDFAGPPVCAAAPVAVAPTPPTVMAAAAQIASAPLSTVCVAPGIVDLAPRYSRVVAVSLPDSDQA
jgi:hypothetical protein